MLLFPACNGYHWYLCVVMLKENVVKVMDGLNKQNDPFAQLLQVRVLSALNYYHKNFRKIHGFNLKTMKIVGVKIPPQQDTYNCGVIILKTMYGLMQNPVVNYSSDKQDCNNFRKYIFFQLLQFNKPEHTLPPDLTNQIDNKTSLKHITIFDLPNENLNTSYYRKEIDDAIQKSTEKVEQSSKKSITEEQSIKDIDNEENKMLKDRVGEVVSESKISTKTVADKTLLESNQEQISTKTMESKMSTDTTDILVPEVSTYVVAHSEVSADTTDIPTQSTNVVAQSNLSSQPTDEGIPEESKLKNSELKLSSETKDSETKDDINTSPEEATNVVEMSNLSLEPTDEVITASEESTNYVTDNLESNQYEMSPNTAPEESTNVLTDPLDSNKDKNNDNDSHEDSNNTSDMGAKSTSDIGASDDNKKSILSETDPTYEPTIENTDSKEYSNEDDDKPNEEVDDLFAEDEVPYNQEAEYNKSGHDDTQEEFLKETAEKEDDMTVSDEESIEESKVEPDELQEFYTQYEIKEKFNYLNEHYELLQQMKYLMVNKMTVKELREYRIEKEQSTSDLEDDYKVTTYFRYEKDNDGKRQKITKHNTVLREIYLYYVGLRDDVVREDGNYMEEYFQLEEELVKRWLKKEIYTKQQRKFLRTCKSRLNTWKKIPEFHQAQLMEELKCDRENILTDIKFPIKHIVIQKTSSNEFTYRCMIDCGDNQILGFPLTEEDIHAMELRDDIKTELSNKSNRTTQTITIKPKCRLYENQPVHDFISKDAPIVHYCQGNTNKCMQYSLASGLKHWADTHRGVYGDVTWLAVKDLCKKIINTTAEKNIVVSKLVQLIQKEHWKINVYPKSKNRRKKKKIPKTTNSDITNTFDPFINKEPPYSLLWGILSVGTGVKTHMVSICGNWIFDPNYDYALPRTKNSLDICCDINRNGFKYKGFIKLYVCTLRK